MTEGRWRLIDLLSPEVLKKLIADGLLPIRAARDATPEAMEVQAMLSKVSAGEREQLTRLDIVILMTDHPGRPPAGTTVRKTRGKWRQSTTRLPHAPSDD